MNTKNTRDPWNDYLGMTEGDMVDELVEHDSFRFGIPAKEARDALGTYDNEMIRKAWWYAIGRHSNEV